jgi:hypothetical protein
VLRVEISEHVHDLTVREWTLRNDAIACARLIEANYGCLARRNERRHEPLNGNAVESAHGRSVGTMGRRSEPCAALQLCRCHGVFG